MKSGNEEKTNPNDQRIYCFLFPNHVDLPKKKAIGYTSSFNITPNIGKYRRLAINLFLHYYLGGGA
jgi:hypothetical protein